MINKQWVLVVKGRKSSLCRSHGIVFGIYKHSKKIVGKQLLNYPVLMKNMKTNVYLDRNELKDFSIYISTRMEKDPNYAKKHFAKFTALSKKLLKTCSGIPKNLSIMDNQDLLDIFDRLTRDYEEIASFMTTPHLFQVVLESRIKGILAKNKLDESNLMLLAIPSSETFEAVYQKDVMRLTSETVKNKKSVEQFRKKWEWISMDDYPYKSLKESDVINLIAMSSKTNAKGEFMKINENQTRINNQAQELMNRMKLTDEEKKIIETLQKYIWLRTARLETFRKFFFLSKPLILEVNRRAGLNDNEIFCLTPPEIRSYLQKGKIPNRGLLEKRTNGYVMALIDGKYNLYSGKKWAEKFEVSMGLINEVNITILKGRTACMGKVQGRVKVIFSKEEISKVRSGDVLVTTMTSPDYVLAMRKAVAIVTDEGGVTCHAAIVSRELNVPCIVGTGNATEVLKDEDLVEVDANMGVITKLLQ